MSWGVGLEGKLIIEEMVVVVSMEEEEEEEEEGGKEGTRTRVEWERPARAWARRRGEMWMLMRVWMRVVRTVVRWLVREGEGEMGRGDLGLG